MRRIVFLISSAVAIGVAAGANAQGGFSGGGSGGMGGGSSFSGGSGGGSSFSGGSSFAGGTGFSGGTSTSGGSFSGGTSFSGTSMTGGTSFTGTSTTGSGTGYSGGGGARGGAGGTGFTPSTTNFESKGWNNVLWSGRPGSTNYSPMTAGGFGQATLPVTGGTTGRTGTAGVARGGAYGRTTGSGSYGIITQAESPITYALEVRFPAPPIASSQVQADLQSIVDRTSQLGQPGTVRVEVIGDVVVLRGHAVDDDERRLVEGMMRVEPGVHEVRNEIVVSPGPPKP